MTEVEEKTEFKFSELSNEAKEKARDEYRGPGYLDYEWWDFVYEDAVRMGALMGINIDSDQKRSANGQHTYTDIGIVFSGFSSQGDGASFEGGYCIVKDGLERVKAETDDEELIRIAGVLSVLQITRRLNGLEPFSAVIRHPDNYNYSGCMQVDVQFEEDTELFDLEDAVTQLMRDFADWIYEQLESEYDWLMSDECVDEYLKDDMAFDESGATI